MQKFITRGPKEGQCNICGEYGELTEDHTPPKGADRITQVEMHHIVNMVSAERPGSRGRISQNGVKFRTLCKKCNNELLGANYDVAFNDFSHKVSSYLTSQLRLPKVMYIKAKPQKIARSLFGHLSAIGVERYLKGPHTEDMKGWFQDESRNMPDYINIHYWVFPYKTQVPVRDAALRNLQVNDVALIWLMKFFPISFLMIWNNPEGYDYPQFPNFSAYRTLGADEETDMPINLNVVPHERWPEAPEDHSFLVYGEGAMGVTEKPKRKGG